MNEPQAIAPREVEENKTLPYWALVIVVAAGMLLGGGGVRFPMYEMLIQLCAIAALVIGLLNIQSEESRNIRFPAFLLLAGGAIALIQIIPLPPGVWQMLPGRETLSELAELTGRADDWRALSLHPELTVQSAISLLVPLAILVCFSCLSELQRENVLFLIVILVAINILVSFAQVISGGTSFYLYSTTHEGLPIGLFANRNHTAQAMLICMFLLLGLILPREKGEGLSANRIMVIIGISLVLAFAIVATNSRTVSLLLLPALLFIGWQLVFHSASLKSRVIMLAGGIAVVAAAIAVFFSGRFGAVNDLVDRFYAMEDHRFEFWPTAIETMCKYMPLGSGLGTFDIAFREHEPLSDVGTHFVNNAHNDFIEIAIETGILGPVLIVAFIVWLVLRVARLPKRQPVALCAAAAVAGVLLHSIVDYPIRTYAVLVPITILVAVLAHSRRGSAPVKREA